LKKKEEEMPVLNKSETPREEAKVAPPKPISEVNKGISSLADIPLLNLGTAKRTL
jgi:hypothetical protein